MIATSGLAAVSSINCNTPFYFRSATLAEIPRFTGAMKRGVGLTSV